MHTGGEKIQFIDSFVAVYLFTAREEMEVSQSHSRAWKNMIMVSRGVKANTYVGNALSDSTENRYSEEKSSIIE